ncbi:hypothetical protein DFH11DRAFT_1635585 [Phellopilus nigrolimitatus]|nr:hypothetical protein DFH11DRAFT_1635585 [Phellopilus nigrolimitatus]
MVTAIHRPDHAAIVQDDNCAESRHDQRTSSGLSQKHAEEIGTSEEDGTVEKIYGNSSISTANTTAGSVENAKNTAGLGSRRPTSPEELWGSAVWDGWCKSIDQLAAETEQERMLRIIDEPYKESIGLSLAEACELDYLDNFLTPEAVLHIHQALSQFLLYRNMRGISRIERRRKYKPSPLSASFLPGSFGSEGNNIEENIKGEGEELDSDKPIAMIFSRRGARLELPKFDQLL